MGWIFRVSFVTEAKFFVLPLQLHLIWGQHSLYLGTKGSSHTTKPAKAFGAKIKNELSLQFLQPSKYLQVVGQDMHSLWSIIMLYFNGFYCHTNLQGGQNLVTQRAVTDKVTFLGMITYLCSTNCNFSLSACPYKC
jgi:hypothetical protein